MYLNSTMHEAGVYVHIPFCAAKCSYCDFLSFSGMEKIYDCYVTSLLNEIRTAKIEKVTTVYIGGGTPTVLPINHIQSILACIYDLPLTVDAEISIEVNPGTVNHEYFKLLNDSGVNRLSFGLQTTNNQHLLSIGRIHTYEQFINNYHSALENGFKNINVDLIFNLPYQTVNCFYETLIKVISLKPQHISFYSLTLCENTPLWIDIQKEVLTLSDEVDRSMYYLACKQLSNAGFIHYEISNAAKPGFECKHNIDCWLHKPYIGFGLGSHSFDGVRRWNNPENFNDYFNRTTPVYECLCKKDLISEAMILGLRLLDGINEQSFIKKYGVIPSEYYSSQIKSLLNEELICKNNNRIYLTPRGLDFANYVFTHFMEV